MATRTAASRPVPRSRTFPRPGSVQSAARARLTSSRSRTERVRPRAIAAACLALPLLVAGCGGHGHKSAHVPGGPVLKPGPSFATGIHKIRHIVVIMQENRSFDTYFGTYPGADGIPHGVCVPDPLTGSCVHPFHNPADANNGGPHAIGNAHRDIDQGAMDGFVSEAERGQQCSTTD